MSRRTDIIIDLETHLAHHVSLAAIAQYLGVQRKTVVKWIQAGHMPAYRFGRTLRVRTGDLRIYVASAKYQISA